MPSEFFSGRGSKNQQQSSVDVGHRGNSIKCKRGNRIASFLHTAFTHTTKSKHHSRSETSELYPIAA